MNPTFAVEPESPSMNWQAGLAPARGTNLAYVVSGSGDPVVLLHGFSFDLHMWDDQVEALAPRFTVIRYDLRGFGDSSPGSTQYTHAGDLEAVLDHIGVERAALVGFSLGGGAAINFAITRPDRVSALAVVDPSLGGFTWSAEFVAAQSAIRGTARSEGIDAARELWLGLPMFAPALRNPLSAGPIKGMVGEYSGWHWVNPDLGIPFDPPAIERLGSIRAPTLVIAGDKDSADFHGIASALEAGIPGARKVVMPGVGHMANLEAPERFNRLLVEFLDGAGKTQRATAIGARTRRG